MTRIGIIWAIAVVVLFVGFYAAAWRADRRLTAALRRRDAMRNELEMMEAPAYSDVGQ